MKAGPALKVWGQLVPTAWKVYLQFTTYNYLMYIYLSTYNLYDSLISTKIRWMWRFRTGTTGANKVITMNIIGVKVGGKVLPENIKVNELWSLEKIDLSQVLVNYCTFLENG